MGIFNRAVVATMPLVPRSIVWRFARRYIAGWTLDEAVGMAQKLQAGGTCTTFDVLGEFVENKEDCERFRDEALAALKAIREQKLDASLSVKLTQFGLLLDKDLCLQIMRQLAKEAGETFIQIDMEDSPCTTPTLDLYRELQKDCPNVGIVLQAYLRRTPEDIDALGPLKPTTRLCKGIYVEPPEIAYKGYAEIQQQYLTCLGKMLDMGWYVGIATHDPYLVSRAEAEIKVRGLGRESYEFQMLLGVAENLRQELIDRKHRVRVYLPYGKDWYAYATRRLQENPAVAGHIVKNLFSRG